MELNGYRLLLPEGTLDYFDLVDVKESVNEVVIYLEEKNIVPEKYTAQDTESKGFLLLLLFRIFLFVARRSSLIFVVVAGS
ncbi:hypothetical protein HMPREF1181_02966 [Bacteroides stercoris CC31F]|uniref:Uncharacterized protein n=1 Tax=Bacteroides stercoris CC31F TaxID=1073351 RepID=S3Y692_BACSE|nr:hypothetical protein HMPREF1181_02966 [Bacteroides stercoris CC31F]